MVGGGNSALESLKTIIKSQMASCLSDSTLGMYFYHFVHIFNVVLFSFIISHRVDQFKCSEHVSGGKDSVFGTPRLYLCSLLRCLRYLSFLSLAASLMFVSPPFL